MAIRLANPTMHVITQSATGLYEVWSLEPEHDDRWLTRVTKGHAPKLAAGTKFTTVGGYVLVYTPPSEIPADGKASIDFTLLHFDPSLHDPLAGPVQQGGSFSWFKFTGGYSFSGAKREAADGSYATRRDGVRAFASPFTRANDLRALEF